MASKKVEKKFSNNKHKLFAEEYISNGFNATRAYMKIYKVEENIAGTSGYRLLKNVQIKEFVNEAKERMRKELDIKKEDILMDLLFINERNKEDNPQHALKAIEIINKMLGLNEPDRQDISISEQPLFGEIKDEDNDE